MVSEWGGDRFEDFVKQTQVKGDLSWSLSDGSMRFMNLFHSVHAPLWLLTHAPLTHW